MKRIYLTAVLLLVSVMMMAQEITISYTHSKIGLWDDETDEWDYKVDSWKLQSSVITYDVENGMITLLLGGEKFPFIVDSESTSETTDSGRPYLEFDGYLSDVRASIQVYNETDEYGPQASFFVWYDDGWVLAKVAKYKS